MRIDEIAPLSHTSTQVRAYVYKGVHKVTGEYYFGYRERNVKLNRTSDIDLLKYRTSSSKVRAIFEEFDWQVLAEFLTGDDAFEFEQALILEHWNDPLLLNRNCRLPNGKKQFRNTVGYWTGKSQSDEANAKRSASLLGHPGAWTGKSQSDEANAKRSASMKGKNTWMAGTVRNSESNKKTSQTMIGKNTWSKGKHWWNNGITSKTSVCQPGPEWMPGRMKAVSKKGKKNDDNI